MSRNVLEKLMHQLCVDRTVKQRFKEDPEGLLARLAAAGIETRTVPARGMAGDASVLVYDASISAALRNAASAQSTLLRGAPLTAAAAQLTLASAEIDGQLLVSVDRGMERTKNDLSAAINAVFEMPGATPRTLGELLAQCDGGAGLADDDRTWLDDTPTGGELI